MTISVSIVEDDSRVRASLARLVDGAPGFRCVSNHSSAEDALQDIPRFKPNVVLMDINLPGINGVDFVTQARQIEPSIPIFIVTGNIQLPEIIRIGNMGVTQIIPKPIDIKAFLEEVQKVVIL